MTDFAEKAGKYAAEKTNELFSKAIAQAYADGYRDGYKDCQEVNTEKIVNIDGLVDLGLPSGTLWSPSYMEDEGEVQNLPYGKAFKLGLPTEEQIKELLKYGKWYGDYSTTRQTFYAAICRGASGEEITINCFGYEENGKNVGAPYYGGGNAYFWIFDNEEGDYKKAVHISSVDDGVPNLEIVKLFSGYKLPVLRVGKKNL